MSAPDPLKKGYIEHVNRLFRRIQQLYRSNTSQARIMTSMTMQPDQYFFLPKENAHVKIQKCFVMVGL
ncbi:hypothetical protein HYQ46_002868 [Verticillium longisporum]|nr:hypothetical protein HYQ46_002868 [Verticillium longisporum]